MSNSKLVGILNITPDSFSDGGAYNEADTAAKQLDLMLSANPDVIDIGAISTRPKTILPSVEEEIARFEKILPGIIPILNKSSIPISIDSYNYQTILYLLDKIPVAWINDQSGCIDSRIIDLVREKQLKLVLMHQLNIPADPNKTIPVNLDVTLIVIEWLKNKAHELGEQGLKPDQIILDPGIGFGKTSTQSWKLIKDAILFTKLGYPVMYGHSRKSFLNNVTDRDFSQRDPETAMISAYLANSGVDYLRIHDIDSNAKAIKLSKCLR
jgi:dihydropteroate synthase